MPDPSQAADLRRALARFVTGVTIVTAADPTGMPIGVTVNSFSSVSLDPPLVLWSLSARSSRRPGFLAASHFVINVLDEAQQHLSTRFAGPPETRFRGVDWQPGLGGAPILAGCLATFECAHAGRIPAGDHLLLLGLVERFRHRTGMPLVFFASSYGLPRDAA